MGLRIQAAALEPTLAVRVGCTFFIALAAIIWYFRRRIAAVAAPDLNASNPSLPGLPQTIHKIYPNSRNT